MSSFTQKKIPPNPNPAQYIILSDSDYESTTSHDSIGKANLVLDGLSPHKVIQLMYSIKLVGFAKDATGSAQ